MERVAKRDSLVWVIFDVDGTVADTLPLCLDAYRHAFAVHGHPGVDDDQIRSLFGADDEGIIRALLGDAWEPCYADYFAYYTREHEARVRPIAGVRGLLAELARRGVRLSVLTGKGEATARYSLAQLGLLGFFDDVVCGSPDGLVKRERLVEMLASSRLSGNQVAYVGDHPDDVIAAREAGIVAVGVAWTPDSSAEALRAAGAAIVALRPEDMLAFVTQVA